MELKEWCIFKQIYYRTICFMFDFWKLQGSKDLSLLWLLNKKYFLPFNREKEMFYVNDGEFRNILSNYFYVLHLQYS